MDVAQSVSVAANGTAVAVLGQVPAGLQWIVYQVGAETVPARNGSTVTLRKNGRFLSSAPLTSAPDGSSAGASASGPPAFAVHPGDQMSANFAGMTSGDSCSVTWYYNEYPWGSQLPPGMAVV